MCTQKDYRYNHCRSLHLCFCSEFICEDNDAAGKKKKNQWCDINVSIIVATAMHFNVIYSKQSSYVVINCYPLPFSNSLWFIWFRLRNWKNQIYTFIEVDRWEETYTSQLASLFIFGVYVWISITWLTVGMLVHTAAFVQAGPDCISHTWWLPWAYQPVISWLKSIQCLILSAFTPSGGLLNYCGIHYTACYILVLRERYTIYLEHLNFA